MEIGDRVQTLNTLTPITGEIVDMYKNYVTIADDDAETVVLVMVTDIILNFFFDFAHFHLILPSSFRMSKQISHIQSTCGAASLQL